MKKVYSFTATIHANTSYGPAHHNTNRAKILNSINVLFRFIKLTDFERETFSEGKHFLDMNVTANE